jgi:Raf kinase inhibitor-like YbhB/YbcL family protein
MRLTTTAFESAGKIPPAHTCDGSNVSPPLSWEGAPSGVGSFALTVDDPDSPAGDWVHWLAFNIPASVRALPGAIPQGAHLPMSGRQGRNDFGELGYGGPCPPHGHPHRYVFKLYALDSMLDLPGAVTKADLDAAMRGHILAHAELTGRYQRHDRASVVRS